MPFDVEDDGLRGYISSPLCVICKNLDRNIYRVEDRCTKGISVHAPVRRCKIYTCEHFVHDEEEYCNRFFDHIDGQFIPLSWDEIRRRRLEKEQREKKK